MGLNRQIAITAEQRALILALLAQHLPDTEVWAYGSRVIGTSTEKSDLDLVVFATPEQSAAVGQLREEFEESNLPFRVDLFVWDDVPSSFRERIRMARAPLVETEGSPGAGRRSPSSTPTTPRGTTDWG